MSAINLLQSKRQEILALADEHGANHVRIFGSVARGDDQDSSDIDFLVDFDGDRSLIDYVALLQDLEDLLGRKVELAQSSGLHPLIRDRVLREARTL